MKLHEQVKEQSKRIRYYSWRIKNAETKAINFLAEAEREGDSRSVDRLQAILLVLDTPTAEKGA